MQAGRIHEAGFPDALLHLQTLHGALILHSGISLSVKSAFQNKSFAYKLTGITLWWRRAKTNFPFPVPFKLKNQWKMAFLVWFFFDTYTNLIFFPIAKLKYKWGNTNSKYFCKFSSKNSFSSAFSNSQQSFQRQKYFQLLKNITL